MSLYTGMQDLSGARFTEANHSGDIIDLDVLRAARERGEALPTAGDPERDKYHGAVVFNPVAGLHRNVYYPDYSSLYPNIMRDCNASPDTIVGVGEETLFRSEYSRDELRWSYIDPRPVKHLTSDELFRDFTDGEYKMVYDPNGNSIKWRDDWSRVQEHLEPIYFLDPDIREGVLPSRADTYIRWNKAYEGTMYKATKRTRNSLYGVSGDNNFRLFDWRVAEAITIGGRLLLEYGAETIIERLSSVFDEDVIYRTHGDSVPGDEPVIVRRGWGDVDVLPAKVVHDNVQAGEWMHIWSDDGWTEIKRSIKKPNRKEHYITRTKSGIVRTTEDHSLLDADGIEVTPEEVDEGDALLHRDVGETLVDGQQTWQDDAAWLLGLFVADGTAGYYEYDHRSDKYSWAITNESRERLERAQAIMHRVWDFETTINDARESSGCYKLQSTGRQHEGERHGSRQDIVEQFEYLCYVDGEKRVPRSILNGSRSERRAFLDGYLQGDGGRLRYGLDGFDEMTTSSRVLAAQLVMMLRDEGETVTIGFDPSHGNLNYRLRRVSYQRGDPTEVESIQQIEYDGDHVYDFETANHHFHAGVGSTIVHNTDGFGIAVDEDVGRGHVLPRVQSAVEWLNDTGMPQFVEETFGVPADETAHEVDLESYSPKLFIPSDDGTAQCELGTKKTYAERVTWDEGEECDEVHLTGIEAKRSDIADITEDVQTDVLEAILYNEPLNAQSEVYERIRTAVERIRNGDVPLAELGERSGMSKPPEEYGTPNRTPQPTYRGALYAKQHIDGEEQFDKPMKFPVARIHDPYPSTYTADTAQDGDVVDYIAVEDPSNIPEEIVIDREQIIEDTVKQPLEPILGTMGWKWDEAVHGHEQTGLNAYA